MNFSIVFYVVLHLHEEKINRFEQRKHCLINLFSSFKENVFRFYFLLDFLCEKFDVFIPVTRSEILLI